MARSCSSVTVSEKRSQIDGQLEGLDGEFYKTIIVINVLEYHGTLLGNKDSETCWTSKNYFIFGQYVNITLLVKLPNCYHIL